MRRYEVGIHPTVDPVIVEAEEAVWDQTLKFMVGDRKVAVFFSPLWFREVGPVQFQNIGQTFAWVGDANCGNQLG